MAYKVASNLAQAKARRVLPHNLPDGFDELTDEQKRDCLKAAMHAVEQDLLQERDKWRRAELGRKKFAFQEQMSAIRKKKKCPGVESFFIDVCRERMGKVEFQLVMTEASNRWRQEQEKE